jgi:hypothetical protein
MPAIAGLIWAGAALGSAQSGPESAPPTGARLTQLQPAAPQPTLTLLAAPRHPLMGEKVSLLVSGAPAGAQFRWSWTAPADGRHDSGAVPGTTIRPLAPGVQRVTVRVISADDPQNVTLTLSVAPPISSGAHARRRDRPHVRGESPRLRKRAGTDDRPSIATVAARTHSLAPPARAEHTGRDPAVTIADFRFTPATITVHVGDTVTWTNHGPSHTRQRRATAASTREC